MNSLAFETAYMMYEPGERTKNLCRIEALIENSVHGREFHNIALHLYEKNGFVIEGVKKNSMIIQGEFVDEYYMGRIM